MAGDLVITEIHFNPRPPGVGSVASDNTEFEFIEIQNNTSVTRQLQGVHFSDGITFTFPASALAPGARAVVVKNAAAFRERYGQAIPIAGTFTGVLSDAGELITLRDADNAVLQSFAYVDTWAEASDGDGHSLVIRDSNQPLASWQIPSGWHASSRIGGSPSAVDTGIYPGAVVINELLAHQDLATGDWLELHNTSPAAIDVGGWYLSDDPGQHSKYRILDGTTIQPGGYFSFTQTFQFGGAFAFSELGDEAVLTAPLGLQGENYGDYREFGATDNGISLGRYVTSTGVADFARTFVPTRNAANTAVSVGPVVISEIMYHPESGQEFIELRNPTPQSARLFDPARPANTWRITQGIDYEFPQDITIPASGFLLLVSGDAAEFRTDHNVPASVPIYSYAGSSDDSLSNAGEAIELSRPGVPEPPESEQPGFVPHYTVDLVAYDDVAPWSTSPDGGGPSLIRKTPLAYGNDVVNWQTSGDGGSPGRTDVDTFGPRVTSVSVRGSSWAGEAVEVPVGDASQLLALPFTNVDRITLTFDEPVTTTATAMSLSGVNIAEYAVSPSVAPGVAATTITWSLGAPIGVDKLLLDLESEETLDAAGNRLDGEWIDGSSEFPTGNGAAGGDFLFRFNVLPGDVDQSGTVTMADLAAARQSVFTAIGSAGFDASSDVDGSGKINVVDMIRVRNRLGTRLPTESPSPPAETNAPSAIVSEKIIKRRIGRARFAALTLQPLISNL
jgi:hypothetical protein